MAFPSNGTWLSKTEFALCITLMVICITLVSLRLWSRTLSKGLRQHALTLSDIFVVIGCLAALGNTSCDIAAVVSGGSGRHVDTVTNAEQIVGQKSMFTAAFFWLTATCMLKISILFLYTEIFSSQIPRLIAYGIIALVSMFFFSTLLVIFLQCFPFSMNWLKDERGHCVNLAAEARAGAFINVAFDIMLTIFPIPNIWPLQMPLRKRLYIIGIFGLGTAADGVNIARAILAMNPSGPDYTYFSAKTNILAGMELWLGVIIACVPTLKPAFSKMHLTMTSFSSFSSRGYKSSGDGVVQNLSGGPFNSFASSSQPSSAPLSKTPDAWERQYQYLGDSREDVVALQAFNRHGVTDTKAQGIQAAVSPASSRSSDTSREVIKVRSDLEVYQTTRESYGESRSGASPANGYSMV